MDDKLSKYLATETTSSAICNGVLNALGGFAVFHGRSLIPIAGPKGLVMDSIGQTFLVVSLSILIPSLLTRRRRRAGVLPPAPITSPPVKPGNLYVRSLIAGVVLAFLIWACNSFLLPRVFPADISFRSAVLFKTICGAIIGCIASALAISAVLKEAPTKS